MHSFWQKTSFLQETDLIIVGAGLTGLLSALKYKQSNPLASVRVVEKSLFPDGASVRNAGFTCFGSLSEIIDDMNRHGNEAAINRVVARYKGLQSLLSIVDPKAIDYSRDGGYEIFTDKEEHLFEECRQRMDEVNALLNEALGFSPYAIHPNAFGFKTDLPLISIKNEGALHSGKLLDELVKLARNSGIEINFGFEVSSMISKNGIWEISNDEFVFGGKQLVVATNGYSNKLINDQRIVPARGQIVLTSPIADLPFRGTFHLHQGYFYFRNVGDRVLLGGGRHLDKLAETTNSLTVTALIQHKLESLLRETIIPDSKFTIEDRWAGTMAFGPENEKDAIIERQQDGKIIAARLGGMGVAMAASAADKVVAILK